MQMIRWPRVGNPIKRGEAVATREDHQYQPLPHPVGLFCGRDMLIPTAREHAGYLPATQLRIKQMAEPTSIAIPLVVAGVGGGAVTAMAGVDASAVIMAFAGASMFAFMSRGTSIPVRMGLLMAAWVFGYYASLEIVAREIWGFKSPAMPSYVAAFFCVAVFKLLLSVFNDEGKAWVRKKLGLSTEGPKDE